MIDQARVMDRFRTILLDRIPQTSFWLRQNDERQKTEADSSAARRNDKVTLA
jgi:hypothetical protein